MFTVSEANQLRASLPVMDIRTPSGRDRLTRSYIEHYGLDLSTEKHPVTHSLGYIPSQEFRIACHYFAPPLSQQQGTAIILHGYYDHCGLFTHLIRNCLGRNLAVLIFDLPGHGLSTGTAASVRSFDQYSQALRDCLLLAEVQGVHKPWYLIGQSTGAAAIANFLLQGDASAGNSFEKIVFLAPLLRPRDWARAQLLYFLLHRFVKRWKRNYAENSHDREFLQFLREHDPLQSKYLQVDWVRAMIKFARFVAQSTAVNESVHIIQGTQDNTVDWQYNVPVFTDKFLGSKTYFIKNARHHLVNESAEIREQVFTALGNILHS